MTKTMDSSENAGTAATPSASGLGKVGPAALKWLKENRGLSPGTLAQLDVASGTAFFPDADRKLPAVYFNYAEGKRRARFRRSISFPEMGSSDRFGIWSACSGPIPRRSTSSRGSSTPAPWSRSVFQPHRCSPLTAPRTNPPRAIRSSSRATPTSTGLRLRQGGAGGRPGARQEVHLVRRRRRRRAHPARRHGSDARCGAVLFRRVAGGSEGRQRHAPQRRPGGAVGPGPERLPAMAGG
jgi:hypothetical protein